MPAGVAPPACARASKPCRLTGRPRAKPLGRRPRPPLLDTPPRRAAVTQPHARSRRRAGVLDDVDQQLAHRLEQQHRQSCGRAAAPRVAPGASAWTPTSRCAAASRSASHSSAGSRPSSYSTGGLSSNVSDRRLLQHLGQQLRSPRPVRLRDFRPPIFRPEIMPSFILASARVWLRLSWISTAMRRRWRSSARLQLAASELSRFWYDASLRLGELAVGEVEHRRAKLPGVLPGQGTPNHVLRAARARRSPPRAAGADERTSRLGAGTCLAAAADHVVEQRPAALGASRSSAAAAAASRPARRPAGPPPPGSGR